MSMRDLFKKSTSRELNSGVQSIHSIEIEDFYRRVRDDELRNTAAMLAVLLRDVYEDAPQGVRERICSEMARTEMKIREIAIDA